MSRIDAPRTAIALARRRRPPPGCARSSTPRHAAGPRGSARWSSTCWPPRPASGSASRSASSVTAETAGSLSAPGGIATALGRLTGLLAAYAMVVVVLLVARVPPLERAIGQDRLVALAPQARAVAAVPAARPRGADHGRLRAAGAATACCTSSASCCGPTPASSPRPPARSSCSPPASPRTGSPAGAWPTRRGGRCTSTPTSRCSCPSRTRSTRAPRSSGIPSRASGGRRCGSGRCGVVVAARIGLPLWRSLRHRVRVVGVAPGGSGRRLDRPARAAGSTGCRSPAASSSSGASCAAGCGGRRTRTRSRRRPSGDLLRITVKDLGDHSARPGAARARHARGDRGPVRQRSPPTPPSATGCCSIGAGVGTAPILALLQELPPRGRRHRAAARLDARGPRPARRGRRRGRSGAAAGCSSSSARATQVAPGRRRLPRARPGPAPTARSTCAAPTPLAHRLAAELRRAGVPERAHPLRVVHVLTESHAPIPDRPRRHRSPAPPASWPSTRTRPRSRPRPRVDRRPPTPSDHGHAGGRRAAPRPAPPPATPSTRSTAAAQVRVTVKGGKIVDDRGAAAAGQRPALAADLLLGRADPPAGGAGQAERRRRRRQRRDLHERELHAVAAVRARQARLQGLLANSQLRLAGASAADAEMSP